MKKMITFLMFMVGCIENGALTEETPDGSQPDAGTTTVQPDGGSNSVDPTLSFTASATSIRLGDSVTLLWSSTNTVNCHGWQTGTMFISGSAYVFPQPDAGTNTKTFSLTCHGTNGKDVSKSITITVDSTGCTPVQCHGLKVYFNAAALANVHHCVGWDRDGVDTFKPSNKSYEVDAPDGICSITCPSMANDGTTVTPTAVSAVWFENGYEVPRYYTTGCLLLPGHPSSELGKSSGGAWDADCQIPVSTLSGPPSP